jgi:hypothetical protein
MPRKGPAPKLQGKIRRNAEPIALRIIDVEPGEQPELEDILGDVNPLTDLEWTTATLQFWDVLKQFPTTCDLIYGQWHLLGRAMMFDDAVNRGNGKYAQEARQCLAKFGVAPDDVARLRIVFAAAEKADSDTGQRSASVRPAGRRPLKAFPVGDLDAMEA